MVEKKTAIHPLDTELNERRKRLTIEQLPISRDLADVGIFMQRVNEAKLGEEQFRKAASIFFKHINAPGYSQLTLEILAGAFNRKDASSYWKDLANLFRNQPKERPNELGQFAMGLAAALDTSFTEKNLSELVELIRNRKLRDRGLLLGPLQRRRRRPEISVLIEELRSDPEFTKEINSWKPLK